MSCSQFYLENLKQLLKVGKATASAFNLRPGRGKAKFPLFPAGFAFREEQFKDYSKVGMSQKAALFHLQLRFHKKVSNEKGFQLFSNCLALIPPQMLVGFISCEISAAMLFSNLRRNAD